MIKADYLRKPEGENLGMSRDHILDCIRNHEQRRHGGGICIEERISAVAFIAHSLGLAADDDSAWEFARLIVKDIYESGHHND